MSISVASFTLGLPLINRLAYQSHSLAPLLLLPNQTGWARDKDESPTDPYRQDTIQLTIQRNIPNSRTLYQLLLEPSSVSLAVLQSCCIYFSLDGAR